MRINKKLIKRPNIKKDSLKVVVQNQIPKNDFLFKSKSLNICVLLICTGKYKSFVENIIKSARKYFLTNQKINFVVFTDDIKCISGEDITTIKIEHLPWPYPTLYRYKHIYNNSNILKNFDYLYYCDVDMCFVNYASEEIISNSVAVIHPGYIGSKGTPERNPLSLAYIDPECNSQYFAGGFNGGRSDLFLTMAKQINENIDIDLSKNIIAIWHDESHMNKYLYENPPSKILSPSYCYPEGSNMKYAPILVALNKNHSDIRN